MVGERTIIIFSVIRWCHWQRHVQAFDDISKACRVSSHFQILSSYPVINPDAYFCFCDLSDSRHYRSQLTYSHLISILIFFLFSLLRWTLSDPNKIFGQIDQNQRIFLRVIRIIFQVSLNSDYVELLYTMFIESHGVVDSDNALSLEGHRHSSLCRGFDEPGLHLYRYFQKFISDIS